MSKKRKYLIVPFILFFLILWFGLFAYRAHLQNQIRNATKINSPNGINSLECINLNGVEQWILIRGEDSSNPLLLFLHGGPGAPLFPAAREIGVKAGLEQKFVMVYWEQRGTGKSFHPDISPETMTIEQLVDDTHVLTSYLKEHLKKKKIFLLGRSFGSLIGILAANRYPEDYLAYIGIGQLVHPLKNDSISYQYTLTAAREQGNKKAMRELEVLGYPPYTSEQLRIQRTWLTKFSLDVLQYKFNYKKPRELKILLATPEYTFGDILRMGRDPFFSSRHLWNEAFYRIDLFKQLPVMKLPVYFIAGRYDYFTPCELARAYFENIDAPFGKKFFCFDSTAHDPFREQPATMRHIINRIRDEILSHGTKSPLKKGD
jgi:pimeloyl-ACP methyl ester carboxylesterase